MAGDRNARLAARRACVELQVFHASEAVPACGPK